MLLIQEKAYSHKYEVENCSNMYIAFLCMAEYSSSTGIQNLSRNTSVILTFSIPSAAAHEVLPILLK
jgi:hypothetical protein